MRGKGYGSRLRKAASCSALLFVAMICNVSLIEGSPHHKGDDRYPSGRPVALSHGEAAGLDFLACSASETTCGADIGGDGRCKPGKTDRLPHHGSARPPSSPVRIIDLLRRSCFNRFSVS